MRGEAHSDGIERSLSVDRVEEVQPDAVSLWRASAHLGAAPSAAFCSSAACANTDCTSFSARSFFLALALRVLDTFQNACVFHTKPPRAFGPFFTACRTALMNISRAERAPGSVRGKEIARET